MPNRLTNKNHDHYNQPIIRNAIVRARVNSNTKHDVENVLHRLGLTMSEAISLYLSQIQLTDGIPFAIKIPNKITLKTFSDTDQNKNVKKAINIKEIFKKAGL